MIETHLSHEFPGTRDQKGYLFKVLHREGDLCLLEKHNPAHKSGSKYYEVVIIQHRPEVTWPDGSTTQARESMPSPEEWGTMGWNPATLEAAWERFNEQLTLSKIKGNATPLDDNTPESR